MGSLQGVNKKKMNTQTLLFERSAEMPEGLYIELMNRLKLDFEKKEETTVKHVAIIINKSIPKFIQMKKTDMIKSIVKASVDTKNREKVLLKLVSRTSMDEVKNLCIEHQLPTMTINTRWVRQQELIANHPTLNLNTPSFRSIAPNILHVPNIPETDFNSLDAPTNIIRL